MVLLLCHSPAHGLELVDSIVRDFSDSEFVFQRSSSLVPFPPVAYLGASHYGSTEVSGSARGAPIEYQLSTVSQAAGIPWLLGERDAVVEQMQAARQQLQAIERRPQFYEALSSLGYAYRKLGDFESALEAYGRALHLKPNYAEAIEYRAEAYLGLNKVEEAQQAYELLFVRDPGRASQLLQAVEGWLDEKRKGADSDAEQLVKVADWIKQKEKAAGEMGGVQETRKEW